MKYPVYRTPQSALVHHMPREALMVLAHVEHGAGRSPLTQDSPCDVPCDAPL